MVSLRKREGNKAYHYLLSVRCFPGVRTCEEAPKRTVRPANILTTVSTRNCELGLSKTNRTKGALSSGNTSHVRT